MEHQARPTLSELTAASLRVGVLGFGGPAAQIALMHKVFVDEKKWIDEPRYLNALNYCMLLPGPEAQQLATYVGWLLHGVKGGLIAGALFVLPGAFVMLGLAWLYAAHGQAPLVAALFYGVKAAVLALVVEALFKIGRRALKSTTHVAIAIIAFLALVIFNAPFPLVILAAALFGALQAWGLRSEPSAPAAPRKRHAGGKAMAAGVLLSVAWLAPLAAAFVFLGPDHVVSEVGALFAHLAVVTFGGAYAVLAYLQTQATDVHGWLTAGQMIDGLGLAETTPGPLILVNLFVGFLAGWQTQGGGAWLAFACALMALWQTFMPSFVWIFAGAPYAEKLQTNRYAAAGLAAITAAVLGVIGSLALTMARHILFASQTTLQTPWGATIEWPSIASLDVFALALAAAAAITIMRFKLNILAVIAGCALAGLMTLL